MHPELLKATVQACREYIDAGDCHGAPPPVERLIDAVVQLADAIPTLSITKDWSERMAEREAGRSGPSAGAVNKDACPDCGQPWADHEWGVPSPYCPSPAANGVSLPDAQTFASESPMSPNKP